MAVIFLLKPTRSLQEYKNFVKEQLQSHYLKHGLSNLILFQQKTLASV